MKRVLWVCVIANFIYSFVVFTDIITPAYIIVLLLLIVLVGSDSVKLTKILAIATAIVGIGLSIFNMGNLAIIASGIAIITEVINEVFLTYNQKKYNKSFGFERVKEKEHIREQERVQAEIVSKYDIDRIKESFENFVSNYDKTNYMINMKYIHTINVANNALNIAKSIGLDDEGKFLAYLIGILHDIGRFDQIKEANTLEENDVLYDYYIDEDLLSEGLIRQFLQETKYDSIILKAIRNHNKYNMDESLTDDEKLYCSIIRDSDKLDTFRRLSEGNYKNDYCVTKEMVMSQEIIQEINKKHTINSTLVNNKLEQVIFRLSMIYDINYKYTLEIIKQNDYLNKYIVLIDTVDINKLKLKKIVNNIYSDIEDKL